MKLKAQSLACVRGGRMIFENVSFDLDAGEGMLLTGPNGSGKTSLLRIVAGLLDPAGGEIALDGGDDELTVGQHAHFIGHLDAVKMAFSVEENLQFWAGFFGAGDVTRALKAFNLEHLATIPAALLSAGLKRRLGLARLVLVPRAIWLLDEPSVSLDAASRDVLAALVQDHMAQGGLAIASTHADLGIRFSRTLSLEATHEPRDVDETGDVDEAGEMAT